jgi:serine protease Do
MIGRSGNKAIALLTLLLGLGIALLTNNCSAQWSAAANSTGTSSPSAVSSGQATPTRPYLTSSTIRDIARSVESVVVTVAVEAPPPDPTLDPSPIRSLASGFVVRSDGGIVTNYHVIKGASSVKVILSDGREFVASVVGQDETTDIAALRIVAANLPVARLGDSDQLEIGDLVVAIGNASGLEGGPTASLGIVSALHRSVPGPTGSVLDDMIQTDAGINSGSSGGPLVNLDGEVVGINTATFAGSPVVGFAISIDNAKPLLDSLFTTGRVIRPYLGLDTVSVTSTIATHLNLAASRGALVTRVNPDGPAAASGVRLNDVITRFGTIEIYTDRELRREILRHQVGDRVDMEIVRGTDHLTVSVTLSGDPSL